MSDQFYVVYGIKPYKDEFSIVGLFTKEVDANEHKTNLENSGKIDKGSGLVQPSSMDAIIDYLTNERLGEMAAPFKAMLELMKNKP